MNHIRISVNAALLIVIFAVAGQSQTTEFTYQGLLQSGGVAASGSHDFEFLLFDAAVGGSQVGAIQTRNSVAIENGAFAVTLDFGPQFPGADRYLEIRVRPTGGGAFTTLAPRQRVSSAPYSIKSLNAETAVNATQLGGVESGQYVLTNDPRMTDARPPTAGSIHYIHNSTNLQTNSNFSISGNGRIGNSLTFGGNADKQILVERRTNLGFGQELLIRAGAPQTGSSTDGGTLRLESGIATGDGGSQIQFSTVSPTLGTGDKQPTLKMRISSDGALQLFGRGDSTLPEAMISVERGVSNSAPVGRSLIVRAGSALSGSTDTPGGDLILQGGTVNGTGESRILFQTAQNAVSGTTITGPGTRMTIRGNGNVGIGTFTPLERLHVNGGGIFSNSLGIGTTTPAARLDISDPAENVTSMQISFNGGGAIYFGRGGCTGGPNNSVIGVNGALDNCTNYTLRGNGTDVLLNKPVDGQFLFRQGNNATPIFRIRSGGVVQLAALGTAGGSSLCRNSDGDIAACSSSLRYKSNVATYTSGFDLLKRLRPVTFNWKDGGTADLGLVAEEVAEIEPLLTTLNANGEIEGVKYDRIGVVLVNAVKEQQAQIDALQRENRQLKSRLERERERIDTQGAEIDALKAIVCKESRSGMCSPRK